MNAQIITIGDELLIGQVVDANAAFIGKQLTQIGIAVNQIKTIEDAPEAIYKALQEAEKDFQLVVVTGGLGPTKDDMTKAVFCEFFDDKLQENPEVLAHIHQLLNPLKEPLLEEIAGQAMLPTKARILPNAYGTAAGMWFEKDKVVYIALPGVPYEMKALLMKEVIPRLVKEFDRPYILHKTMLTYGMGESRLARKTANWEKALPAHFSLAYLPNPGQVRLRITAKGTQKEQLQSEMQQQLQVLEELLKEVFGGYEGEQNLQERIAARLTSEHKTLSVAESCTGGKLAAFFTEIPGASAFFKGGLVPYATEMKIKILGVSEATIRENSVVSQPTVSEMAQACKTLFQTDYAIATTGNAGPTKGDSDADIGTVCIALAGPDGVLTREFQFGKSRGKVVRRAVMKALEMIDQQLVLERDLKKKS